MDEKILRKIFKDSSSDLNPGDEGFDLSKSKTLIRAKFGDRKIEVDFTPIQAGRTIVILVDALNQIAKKEIGCEVVLTQWTKEFIDLMMDGAEDPSAN